jgi:hydrogenase expression/formation protein HypC
MCLGLPMTVLDDGPFRAGCARGGEVRVVDMMLVGAQPPGTRVLVHIDRAVRVLDPEEADAIDRALDGLAAAIDGKAFDHWFADLLDREPTLPDHLRTGG